MEHKQEGSFLRQNGCGKSMSGEEIVITGVAGLYPSSHHVKDLSNILYEKINPITSNTRWKYNHPEVAQYSGSVPGLEYFDAQFFKVHYVQSNNMDSMSRKLLEQTYAAIYDAGVSPEHLLGKKVGVYVGSCFSESEKSCFYAAETKTGFGIAGCSKTMFANRVSYWLNLKGPSMSIDQSCTSSTAALESAYLAILRGECEAAIVGGANICLHPQSSIHYGRIMKLSMDGKTRSFDSNASGCIRSEAINVVFLQKSKDACRIYAEIVHVKTEFNSILETESGPKYGFYRDPSKVTSFLKSFYKEAKVQPQAVQYLEAFGSAVPEADKAELEAIDEVFCKGRRNPLIVGSVMSNIGYGEAASGISSITKVLLGYHHGKIAGNLHCDSPRQDVAALREGRLRIVSKHEHFNQSYTAVNNFSITGVNAHVLLKGHYKPKDLSRYKSNIPHLVLVSARQDTAVRAILDDLKTRVVDPEELALFNKIHETKISGHLGRGFTILDSNCTDTSTMCLREVADYFDEAKRPVWFVYSGMGSQWPGMGAQLMRIPIFAAAIERCHRVLEPKGIDIVHIITSPDKAMFDNILHSFVGIAAIQIGLTDILLALNITPDKIIGHSVGELGCAYADGCFTAEEMILSAYSRGLVSVQTPFIRGSMAAVGLGYVEILKLCPPEVEVACHNGPDSSTISGPADIMKEFVASLTSKGVFAKEVPCSNIAYHSRYIAEAGPGLLKYLSEVIKLPKPRTERWVSTSIPQDRWDEPIAKYSSAEYHTNNLLNAVLFEETSKLIPPNALVIEIAPHGLLQAILKRSLPESCCNIPLTLRRHPDNAQFLLEALGQLYMKGCIPKVSALYAKVEFPVSTGTPMLSHLVQWAHHEKWHLPLYVTANRKVAACYNNVLSVHDDEHEYLRGHMIRGKNVYPFAATLVAVWDTLAMSLGEEPKKLPVQFHNVHLQSQPILHERRQLRLSISLHRGSGLFEVMDDMVIIAKGYIMKSDEQLKKIESDSTEHDFSYLNTKEIYQLLHARDYGYKGAFRSILTANSTLSSAEIIWKNNWVTLIDGMLQLNMLNTTHYTVSQPDFIRKLSIDVDNHLKESYEIDGEVVIKAHLFDLHDRTRCGGVSIENIKFLHLLPLNDEIALQSLKFVPFFSNAININESAALSMFIQIAAENLKKKKLNILEVANNKNCLSNYKHIEYIINALPGFDGSYSKMYVKNIFEEHNDFLANADILLIENLGKDDNICQKLNRVLRHDMFIINKEYAAKLLSSRPSVLYRTISAHNIGDMKLELALWRPSLTVASSVITVRSSSDLNLLSSTLAALSSKQRIIVLSSNPPVPGLKFLVRQYRTERECKVNLIMYNQEIFDEKQYRDQKYDCDLAFSVVDHGMWGGEYYLPIEPKSDPATTVVLKTGRIADLDSLSWEKIDEPVGPGVTVKVQYAGINVVYVNKQTGISKLYNDYNQTSSAIDFSGTTVSGARVMGVTQTEGLSSSVKVNYNLLWPVPEHWSLEDAATVPLAYCMAFYMLGIKSQLNPKFRILVNGGTGALGQAIISIALGHNCEVFTTVSDMSKKRFLQKLFPKLKADHIGNSRDSSFADLVLSATKGKKCNLVIICSKDHDKTSSLKCCSNLGIVFDTAQIHNREEYNYGMSHMNYRSYFAVDFSSIFNPEYTDDMKRLQILLSEGIARGYVRPLTRLTFSPQEVARAFRLVATSRHRGRVLVDLRQATLAVHSRLVCSLESCQLIWSDNTILGIKLVDKLISQGAKKIFLHLNNFSNAVTLQLRFWQNNGVQVKISTERSCDIPSLLKVMEPFGQIDNVFIIISDQKTAESEVFLENVSIIARNKISPKLFTIIRSTDMIGENHILPVGKQKEVMNVYLPPIRQMDTEEQLTGNAAISINGALDALTKALSFKKSVVLAHVVAKPPVSLLEQISTIANLNIRSEMPAETSLKELYMDGSKASAIHAYLQNVHNICIAEDSIPSLSIKSINDLEKHQFDRKFKDHKGLETFFSHIDPDEMLATAEMLPVPTRTNNSSMRDDEFDASETYLCVVPGVEGLHSRFREMCERLKLPALVLQPGLSSPHETLQEMAQRYAKTLLVKTELKNKFYLLGYETGVMVALEVAAILEDHGLTGTVFCVGGSPDEILAAVEEILQDFNTDVALQKAVIKHMLSLMVHDIKNIDDALSECTTWRERVNACFKSVNGRIPHSKQYAIGLIEAAYARIVQVRKFVAKPRALRSLVISLRPKYFKDTDLHKLSLNDYSKQPVITYQLEAPLAYATQDLRCAAIINRHLDDDILNAFSKRNLCDSYLLNAQAFMATHAIDDI